MGREISRREGVEGRGERRERKIMEGEGRGRERDTCENIGREIGGEANREVEGRGGEGEATGN